MAKRMDQFGRNIWASTHAALTERITALGAERDALRAELAEIDRKLVPNPVTLQTLEAAQARFTVTANASGLYAVSVAITEIGRLSRAHDKKA